MKTMAAALMTMFALSSATVATVAQARPQAESGARHQARAADTRERYPAGTLDFYYQFADGSVAQSWAGTSGADRPLAVQLAATDLLISTGGAWSFEGVGRGDEPIRQGVSAAAMPGMALPLAALALMIFVARRRLKY